ncbi:MAG TPA: hypothetical protein VKU82_15690 [Planctomycetaceae bacterium]|nr:hypothetical protein [Planctomycetaceae bacterium]
MLRFLLVVVELFRVLPWWGAAGVLILFAISLVALGRYLVYRLQRDLTLAVAQQGQPLENALVEVHSVEPTDPPLESSLIGLDPDDEDYDPELDGGVVIDDSDYFLIDATIAPRDPEANWDPTALAVVNAAFVPQEELEACLETGLVHTLEVWRDGNFAPQQEGELTGPQRLRMLVAVPKGLRQAKFAYHFTYFGKVTLPASRPRHLLAPATSAAACT